MKNDLRKKAAILSIALFVAGNSIISGSLVFMQETFDISITNAGFLVTLSSIATIVTMILSEVITKKIGMKNCVLLGLFLVAISSIFPIIKTSYWSVFISRIIMGAGVGLFNGHSANYINIFFEGDEASRLHGIRNSTEFIGQTILLFIAGLLIKIKWTFSFLAYALAFIVLFYFDKTIPDINIEEKENLGKFHFNKQIFFYIFFGAVMIMNVSSLSIRFPTVATLAKDKGADINIYMIALPLSGMISGFLFGFINKNLREKTILLGLAIYTIFNAIIALLGDNMYVFLLCMVLIAFSQSLCTPYLFAEVSRFVRGSHARIANNLIFIGCNMGGFVAPFFLNVINKILHTNSITLSFISFSLIYSIMFLINLREFVKTRKIKLLSQNI